MLVEGFNGSSGGGGSDAPIVTELSSIRVNESTATNVVYTAETSGVYAVFVVSAVTGSRTVDTCTTNGSVLAEVTYGGSNNDTYYKAIIVKLNAGQTVTRTGIAPYNAYNTSATMIYELKGISSATYVSSALNIEGVDSNVTISDTSKKYLVMGTAIGGNSSRFWSTSKAEFIAENFFSQLNRYFFASVIDGISSVIHTYGDGGWGRGGVVLFEIS